MLEHLIKRLNELSEPMHYKRNAEVFLHHKMSNVTFESLYDTLPEYSLKLKQYYRSLIIRNELKSADFSMSPKTVYGSDFFFSERSYTPHEINVLFNSFLNESNEFLITYNLIDSEPKDNVTEHNMLLLRKVKDNLEELIDNLYRYTEYKKTAIKDS